MFAVFEASRGRDIFTTTLYEALFDRNIFVLSPQDSRVLSTLAYNFFVYICSKSSVFYANYMLAMNAFLKCTSFAKKGIKRNWFLGEIF